MSQAEELVVTVLPHARSEQRARLAEIERSVAWRAGRYLLDLPLQQFEGVMVPTCYSARLVRDRVPGVRPMVVPNLVDAVLEWQAVVAADAREEPESPGGVWIGKLYSHKNWRMAVVWGSLLLQELGDMTLTVIGGYTASDERVDEFSRLAEELGLASSLRQIDRIDYARLPALYHSWLTEIRPQDCMVIANIAVLILLAATSCRARTQALEHTMTP